MKKILFTLTFMFAGIMASCGGHKTEVPVEDTAVVEQTVCDSVENTDSVECEAPCDTVTNAE